MFQRLVLRLCPDSAFADLLPTQGSAAGAQLHTRLVFRRWTQQLRQTSAHQRVSGAKQTSSLKHTMILLPLAESRCVA